ncbi:MAG: MFS transporter [Pirellulales bacterium]|nr:MFS transporter [Pirellulales bacterium]
MQKNPIIPEATNQSNASADPSAPNQFYRWELLGFLVLAFFFHQGDRAIFGVVLPAIKSDLQLTDAQLGLVGSVLFFALAVLMPLTGYFGDNWSRKWIITISVTFWSLATMLTGLARGLTGLILFRSVATAGGESFYAPAAYSLLAQFHKKTRSLALSIHQCALYVGVMVSGFLGGYIAEQWGWRATFYIFGGCGVLLGIILAFRLKNSPRDLPTQLGSSDQKVTLLEAFTALFRTPTALFLTTGFTAIVFVNNAYVVWAPSFVQEKFNLSLTAAGGGAMLYHHLAALVGVLIGGKISDTMILSRRQFRLELQAAAMLIGVPTIVWMGLTDSLMSTWIAMACMGLCRGMYESNTQASLFDVIAPRYRASAIAMMTMVAFLFGSTSPWLLGCCCEWFPDGSGLSYGFASLSLVYLIGGLAVLIGLKTTFRHDLKEDILKTSDSQ